MRGKVLRILHASEQPRITPAYAGKSCWPSCAPAALRDHPRVCGEKFCFSSLMAFATGSPPRMRGKGIAVLLVDGQAGITPAYAGKRRGPPAACLRSGDHPRVCGEKFYLPLTGGIFAGSPPRMRGKGFPVNSEKRASGITPAYAGKSASHGCGSRGWRDHPRVCGEKSSAARAAWVKLGSPPRMRGKAGGLFLCMSLPGITPAYAGKSSMKDCFEHLNQDHPRVCGEKTTRHSLKRCGTGSPPRMRGKAAHHEVCVLVLGITPAYAGKRICCRLAAIRDRDHPRVCGEKLILDETYKAKSGSPPRMRGKVDYGADVANGFGITPAYAGKSRTGYTPCASEEDHPRVCGEKPNR